MLAFLSSYDKNIQLNTEENLVYRVEEKYASATAQC